MTIANDDKVILIKQMNHQSEEHTREVINCFAVNFVLHSDLDLIKLVKNVQFCDC